MLYVLITKILFFRKKTKSKVDKSDFKYYKNGCWLKPTSVETVNYITMKLS